MAWKRLIVFLFFFSLSAEAEEFKLDKLVSLNKPWGSTFVDNDHLLVTEQSGSIKLVNIKTKEIALSTVKSLAEDFK